MLLNELSLSDSKIISVILSSTELVIIIEDWQEKQWRLTCYDVFAISALDAENTELSHIDVWDDNELTVSITMQFPSKNPHDYAGYRFIDAWCNQPVLTFIANKHYKLEEYQNL